MEESYAYKVIRNSIEVTIVISANSSHEAENRLKVFLKENTATYEHIGQIIK